MGAPKPPAWWRRVPTLLLNVMTIGAGVALGELLADLVSYWAAR